MIKRMGLVSACVLLATPQLTHASDVRWNGYVNIVGGGLRYDPRSDDTDKTQRPGFLNYEQEPNYDPQSSAALQASKDLDAKSSITTQLFASGEQGDYVAKVKWLYFTYNLNDHSTFRVGRLGNPAYYFSDFFNVGYAYHWVSPPNELYTYDTTVTGMDYIYRNTFGDYEWSAELFTGGTDLVLDTIDANTKSRNIFGGVLNLSTGGWLNLRAMIERSTVSLDVAELDPELVLSQVGGLATPELEARVTDALDLEDMHAVYSELAARAEFEKILLMAEATHAETGRYLSGSQTSWFVTGGWKFNQQLMVHLTYSETEASLHDDVEDDLNYLETHAFSPTTDYLAAAINSTIATRFAQKRHSWSMGSRYELTQNIALKFDVMKFEEEASHSSETAGIGNNTLIRAAMNAVY